MDPALARCLERPVAAVYLVLGAEGLLVGRAVSALCARVEPELGLVAFNLTEARADEPDAVDAVGAARTLPMMAERRLVVIRDLERGSKELYTAVESYLDNPSPTTTLVLAGSGFPKVEKGGSNWSARIPKRVEAAGVVLRYADGSANPVAFAVEHAASLGHALGPEEAHLLVALVGTHLSTIAREVEKVSLYVGEGAPIDATAVTEACSALAERDVWGLTTGVATRDPEGALGALHRLLEQGDAPRALLGLLGWQLRLVLRIAELVRQRVPEDRIRQMVRPSGPHLGAIVRSVEARPPVAAEVLERLARANRAMNLSRAGEVRVLEALVLDLTGA